MYGSPPVRSEPADYTPGMRGGQEIPEIVERAVGGVNVQIIGDVVAVVAQGRWKKRQQPQTGDSKVLQIIEFLGEGLLKCTDSVVIAVEKGFYVSLIDDGGVFRTTGGPALLARPSTFSALASAIPT